MNGEGRLIYHMLPRAAWDTLPPGADYVGDTLASEGFIHCTGNPILLTTVANRFYADAPGDFVILLIDVGMVRATVKWEPADGAHFPHIYGPLNRNAIVDVVPFPRAADATFLEPMQISEPYRPDTETL